MRIHWMVTTLVLALGATPLVQAQTAKDNLEKLKKAEQENKKAAEQKKADKDKAATDKAEKEKADKEKAEKAEKEKADKEKAEKEKAEKEKADKEKADKAKADKAKADKAKPEEADEKKDEKDAPAALIQLRSTRDDRRKASIEKLRARWGVLTENDEAKRELERHARFVANLQRIRTIAEEKKKVKLIEKVDTLLTKEELRHASKMNKLREGAPVAGGVK
jgi:hypothetical protein